MTPTDLLKPKPSQNPDAHNTPKDQEPHPRPVRTFHPWRRVIIVFVLALFALAGTFAYKVYSVGTQITATNEGQTFFGQIKTLISPPEKPLQGEEEGRINILLMGFGGSGHQGAYLTDTMIVASFNPNTHEVAMLSLPRDLYVDIPGYGYRKINNAFAFGQQSDIPDGGENLAQATVQQVLGIPIHYYTWVDFTGFEKIIDDIGGVEIDVDTAFVDYSYPTEDFGYQTIRFDEGTQMMDGETALKFVRSRKGTNGEGSDFARSARQQKVILAVKEKLLGFGTLANPSRVNSVLDDLASHMKTNMQIWELLKLARTFENTTSDQISSRVLDNSTDGLLVTGTTLDGAYILEPRAGDFSEIQYLAQNIFEYAELDREDATIAVLNGTTKEGLARTVADELEGMNYKVTTVSNATAQTTTIIYDLSNGENPKTLEAIQDHIPGITLTTAPQHVLDLIQSSETTDIIIILGEDAIPKNITGGPIT